MANIIPLKDNTGAQFYPQTHEKAVVDSNGVNLQTKLASITTPTYVTAWDGDSTPVVANIPAGVTVTYNTTSYTGTLAASASTANKTYLVSTGTTDNYNRYVTQLNGSTYSWQNIGSTEIDLSDYATKEELGQLEAEVFGIHTDTIQVTRRDYIYPVNITFLPGEKTYVRLVSPAGMFNSDLVLMDGSNTSLGTIAKENGLLIFTPTSTQSQIRLYVSNAAFASAGNVQISIYQASVDASIEQIKDGIILPRYTATSGRTILANGTIGNAAAYSYTSAITLGKKQKIVVWTSGSGLSVISKVNADFSSIVPLVTNPTGPYSTLSRYEYTNQSSDDILVSASYKTSPETLVVIYENNESIVNDIYSKLDSFGIVVGKVAGVNDDVVINAAIQSASEKGLNEIYIPYYAEGYTLHSPIKVVGGMRLRIAPGTMINLADSADCEMVSNVNMTTGTIVDKDIVIEGGIWDGNGSEQEKWVDVEGEQTLTVVMKFSGVENLVVRDCTIQNSVSYGFLGCNIFRATIDNVHVNVGDMGNLNNGDGIHFLGKSYHVKVQNCLIHSEDNCIAFNADDVAHGYACGDGPIEYVELHNNTIINTDGGQGVLLLSAINHMFHVVVDGLYGCGGYCLKIDNFGIRENGHGIYRDIVIRNIDFEVNKNPDYGIRIKGVISGLRLESILLKYYSTDSVATTFSAIKVEPGVESPGFYPTSCIVADMTICGLNILHNWGTKILYAFHVVSGATIVNLTLNDYVIKNPTGAVEPVYASGVIQYLNGRNWDCDNLIDGFIRTTASYVVRYVALNGLSCDDRSVPGVKFYDAPTRIIIHGINSLNFYCPVAATEKVISQSPYLNNNIFSGTNPGYFNAGQRTFNNNGDEYICVTPGSPLTTTWEANHAYTAGQYVRAGEWVLRCLVGGTSGNTISVGYNDFVDGTVTWRKMYNGVCAFRKITLV